MRSAASSALAIFLMISMAMWGGFAVEAVPFATSLVLVCGSPSSPPAANRAILGGHLIAAASALILINLFGGSPVVVASAVGIAVSLMLLTKTFHPPAGITPLAVAHSHPDWTYIVLPVIAGAVATAILARVLQRVEERQFQQIDRAS